MGFVEEFHRLLEVPLPGLVAFDAARHARHQVEGAGFDLRVLNLLGSLQQLQHSISQFLVGRGDPRRVLVEKDFAARRGITQGYIFGAALQLTLHLKLEKCSLMLACRKVAYLVKFLAQHQGSEPLLERLFPCLAQQAQLAPLVLEVFVLALEGRYGCQGGRRLQGPRVARAGHLLECLQQVLEWLEAPLGRLEDGCARRASGHPPATASE